MATDRDQPWWADAQEYRHRDTRRRDLGDEGTPRFEDETTSDAARRRRAAAARASAQQRRSRQPESGRQRRASPAEYQWIDESPFAPREHRDVRAADRRGRERSREAGARFEPGTDLTRRPGGRPARRRRTAGPIARPEKLLLYIAILGLFLVLAAATNSDAAVVSHAASSLAR